MLWWKRLGNLTIVAVFSTVGLPACAVKDYRDGSSAETDPGPIQTGLPETPATCDGTCVLMPPATYTGPSLFSIEEPGFVADCPSTSPYQGIQGLVQGAGVVLFARECLITPNPTCQLQGQTCVPAQDEGFRVCIHHDGDEPCAMGGDPTGQIPGYPYKSRILNEASGEPVTLCCTIPLHMK